MLKVLTKMNSLVSSVSFLILCALSQHISTTVAFVGFHVAPTRASSYHAASSIDDNVVEPHIVILGGGFGGINSALTLPSLPWSEDGATCIKPKITLIDKSERFVFLPLLYELCVDDASIDEVAPTFKSLLSGVGTKNLSSISGLPDLSEALQLLTGASGDDDDGKKDENNNVSFLQAQVEGIDANNNQVVITGSSGIETINYDALIIATGAEVSCDAVPGASEYALPFYTIEQCFELKKRLALIDNYLESARADKIELETNVVVVGGGYSGVELALNLVDRFGSNDVQVTLVHRGKEVLEYATEHNQNAGIERLKSAGVKIMTSTSVAEVASCDDCPGIDVTSETRQEHHCTVKLTSSNGSTDGDEEEVTQIATTLLLWTAGSTPTSTRNSGIRNSVLPRDKMGRILTSSTLNVAKHPNVFAIGDCSRPKKDPYPGTAQVAMQMATVASWNIYATISKTFSTRGQDSDPLKLLSFNFVNLGEMMTLGTNDATISTLGGIELSGPAASWLRRLVYAVRMPTPGQGLFAAVDGSSRKLARGALRSARRKSKPVDWK